MSVGQGGFMADFKASAMCNMEGLRVSFNEETDNIGKALGERMLKIMELVVFSYFIYLKL